MLRSKVREGLLHVASWVFFAGALVAVAATGLAAVAYIRVAEAAGLPVIVPAVVVVAGGGAIAILCAAAGTALQVLLGVSHRLDGRDRGRPAQTPAPWPPATLIDLTRPAPPRPADSPAGRWTVPSR